MKWFGSDHPDVQVGHTRTSGTVEVPVGSPCMWCFEEMGLTDRGYLLTETDPDLGLSLDVAVHLECYVRSQVGPVPAVDEESMTKREAAFAVYMEVRGD